jgi:hypothetical protein
VVKTIIEKQKAVVRKNTPKKMAGVENKLFDLSLLTVAKATQGN